MKRYALGVAAALLLGCWTSVGVGAPAAQRGNHAERGSATKSESYSVVQVGEDVKVIPKSKANEEKKRIANQYKQDKKAYDEANKAAKKNKEKLDMAKPNVKDYSFKVLKTFKSEQEANDWLENYLNGEGPNEKAAKKPAAQ